MAETLNGYMRQRGSGKPNWPIPNYFNEVPLWVYTLACGHTQMISTRLASKDYAVWEKDEKRTTVEYMYCGQCHAMSTVVRERKPLRRFARDPMTPRIKSIVNMRSAPHMVNEAERTTDKPRQPEPAFSARQASTLQDLAILKTRVSWVIRNVAWEKEAALLLNDSQTSTSFSLPEVRYLAKVHRYPPNDETLETMIANVYGPSADPETRKFADGLPKPNAETLVEMLLAEFDLQKSGDRRRDKRCLAPDCGRWSKAHGLCNAHYLAYRRAGAEMPDAVKEPKPKKGERFGGAMESPTCREWRWPEDGPKRRWNPNGCWNSDGEAWEPWSGGMCEKHFRQWMYERSASAA